MDTLSDSFKITVCTLSTAVALGFAVFAGFLIYQRRKSHPNGESLEFFLTARNTQPVLRVTWSFVAGAMGAWVLSAPAGNAADAGVVGLVSYAIFAGFPLFLLALVGDKVQKLMPQVLSFGDYIHYRFGTVTQLYVVLIVVFNLGVALTAEYSTLQSIFASILGWNGFPIVPIIFLFTTVYTAFGGLLVSIVTDTYQGIASTSLVCLVLAVVAFTFRPELGELPPALGLTAKGYNSIFIMPVTLMAATVFTEAPWQRVWASESPQALKRGAFLASVIISLIVFALGLVGFFAAWSGLAPDDPNVLLIKMVPASHSGWMSVLIAVLTAIICESSVDTLQNALVSALSTMFLRNRSLKWVRLMVLLINIPPIIISYYGFSAYMLFTFGNKLTCTAAIPMLMGLYRPAMPYITGPCVLFASILSLLSMVVYGWVSQGAFMDGVTFIINDPYDPFTILVAILSSVVWMGIWCLCIHALGVLNVPLKTIPGFHPRYLNASNEDLKSKSSTKDSLNLA